MCNNLLLNGSLRIARLRTGRPLTGRYRANKAKAVEWATAFVQNNGSAFLPGVADLYSRGGKQDDLADALLLVMYYLDTYSNQLTSQ